MHIIATADVPDSALISFTREMAHDFEVQLPSGRVVLLSFEPPSWINLVAKPEWWQLGLTAIAAVYVAELTKEAAKATWKGLARIASTAAGRATKLSRMAAGLVKLKGQLAQHTEIVISLPQPNEYFGCKLALSFSNLEEVEMQLALFVHHIPDLTMLIQRHEAEGVRAATGYFLYLLDDGSLHAAWVDSESLQNFEVVLQLRSEV